MFLSNRVPPKVRSTYNLDSTAGMLGGVMNGFAVPFFLMVGRETFHATSLELGVISAAPVAGFLLAFVWAKMMEGKRKMPFAVGSWVVSRSVLLLAPLVRNHSDYVIFVTVFWLLSAVASPAYAALMKEIYPDSDRGRIMGYVRVMSFSSIAVCGLIGGKLLEISSFKIVFPVAGLFGIASAFVFGAIPTKETTGDGNASMMDFVVGSLKILEKDKAYRWFCGGIFVAGWAMFMVGPLYTVFQRDTLGGGTAWVGVYTLVTQGMAIFAYYFWSTFIDNKKPVYITALCNLLFVAVPLSYCLANQSWMLVPSCLVLGFVNSGLELAYFNGVMHYAPKDKVPQYQAVHLFLMAIRGIAAPLIGPLMVSNGWLNLSQMFLLCAAMTLASYVMLMVGMRMYDGASPDLKPAKDRRARAAVD